MAIVTISREFRSEGRAVAEAAAEELGWRLVDKAVLGRILEKYGLVQFEQDYEARLGAWDVFDPRVKVMVSMLGRATLAVARKGKAVILGRGSFAVLGGFLDVLHVRVQAPLRSRVERCLAADGMPDLERAEALVRESDRSRRSFVESMYGLRWDAASSFDLVVNTDKVRPESAAAWIASAARGLGTAGRQPSTADIAPDPVLDQVIEELLGPR
ncbi:MAG TPA: cytidylate kinase-like family protein [Spirochaetia bacterium]|nr:cytidylate kinase-like family protein [Spirochaetia bacterium]